MRASSLRGAARAGTAYLARRIAVARARSVSWHSVGGAGNKQLVYAKKANIWHVRRKYHEISIIWRMSSMAASAWRNKRKSSAENNGIISVSSRRTLSWRVLRAHQQRMWNHGGRRRRRKQQISA